MKHIIISDVDGILTSPKYSWNNEQKVTKEFFVNDSLMVKLIKNKLTNYIEDLIFMTGDVNDGFAITKSRLDNMYPGIDLRQVKNVEKGKVVDKYLADGYIVHYFADDIYDYPIFKKHASNNKFYSYTTKHAPQLLKDYALYISTEDASFFTDMSFRLFYNIEINEYVKQIIYDAVYGD